jgi:hypothetical protein
LRLELTLDRATMRLSLEPFGCTDMDVTIEIFPDRLAARNYSGLDVLR